MTRKALLSLLLVFSLLLSPAICFGATYQVTETELIKLEQSYNKQLNIIESLKKELNVLKLDLPEANKQLILALSELKTVQDELTKAKQELILLKVDLEKQKNSLDKANQSLRQYEKEMNKKISILKTKNNFAWIIAVGAVAYGIKK